MASRYWVGGTANWDATAGTKWASTSGGAGGATVPTAADDVFFDANSGAVTITIGASYGANAKTLDFTGFAGTFNFTQSSSSMTVFGSITLSSSMTFTMLSGFTLSLRSSTSASITSAGKTFAGSVVLNANLEAGTWTLQDALSCGQLTFTSGGLNTNNQTVTCGVFSATTSNTRNLTLGTSSITCTTAGQAAWNVGSTNLTLSAASSTITVTGAASSFNSSGTYGTVVLTAATAFNGGPTVTNFTKTGQASKTDVLTTNTSFTVTGTLTLAGNSSINRLLVQSNVIGTVRTITCNGSVVASNVDFMDITGGGTANWDLSAVSGGCGDCGGNSGITFTSSVAQTWQGTSGGNWSDVTKWTSRVPLPQDDVTIVSAFVASQTITMDMPRAGRSIDFSGTTGAPSITATSALTVSIYGSLNVTGSAATFSGTNNTLNYAGRGSYTITSGGVNLRCKHSVTAPGGTYIIVDAFQGGNTSNDPAFVLNNGSLISQASVTLTANFSCFSSSNSNTRSLTMGTNTWTLISAVSGTPWNLATTTGLTFSGASATVVIGGALTTTRTFAGGGQTYNNLVYNVANSPGALVITGANTFAGLNIGPGRTLTWPSGITNTLINTLTLNGQNNGFIYLSGGGASTITTPDSPAVSITGDIDVRVKVAMDDWTPATFMNFITKDNGTNDEWGFSMPFSPARGYFYWKESGGTVRAVNASAAPPVADGDTLWYRATLDVDNGSGGHDVKFYTSNDGSSWAQLGATVNAGAFTTSIKDGTNPIIIGAKSSGGTEAIKAKVFYAEVRNGIDGPVVASFNASAKAFGADTYTDPQGNVWTLNGMAAQGDGRVTVNSSTSGNAATLSAGTNANINVQEVTLKDSTATGGATFTAYDSFSVSNVTGWNLSSKPETWGLPL